MLKILKKKILKKNKLKKLKLYQNYKNKDISKNYKNFNKIVVKLSIIAQKLTLKNKNILKDDFKPIKYCSFFCMNNKNVNDHQFVTKNVNKILFKRNINVKIYDLFNHFCHKKRKQNIYISKLNKQEKEILASLNNKKNIKKFDKKLYKKFALEMLRVMNVRKRRLRRRLRRKLLEKKPIYKKYLGKTVSHRKSLFLQRLNMKKLYFKKTPQIPNIIKKLPATFLQKYLRQLRHKLKLRKNRITTKFKILLKYNLRKLWLSKKKNKETKKFNIYIILSNIKKKYENSVNNIGWKNC